MPVTSLVITWHDDAERREQALAWLRSDRRITLGDAIDGHLPLVTETRTLRAAKDLFDAIEALEGVRLAMIAHLDFSDEDQNDQNDEEPWTDATS